jgi:T-complex protein 1 subunit gamma
MRTTLGPRAMLKMILDPMGGIVMTNDGYYSLPRSSSPMLYRSSLALSLTLCNDNDNSHAILREIDVSHPAAKNLIELSRTQDEEVGDGTTSVIILSESHITEKYSFAFPKHQLLMVVVVMLPCCIE